MTEALSAATAAIEGKMSKSLKKVLKKVFASDAHEQLAVADAKLGSVIKVKAHGLSQYMSSPGPFPDFQYCTLMSWEEPGNKPAYFLDDNE